MVEGVTVLGSIGSIASCGARTGASAGVARVGEALTRTGGADTGVRVLERGAGFGSVSGGLAGAGTVCTSTQVS